MINNDKKLLGALITKYGKSGVNLAINRLNEELDDNISYKEAIELLDKMFDEYVPDMGKADTLGGEILRAFARLYYRCYNDGDVPYIDYGNETCNSSYRFLHNNHVPGFENEYPSQTFYKEWMTYLNKIIVPFYLWISDEEREQYFTISNNVDSRKPSEEDLEWDKEDDMWDDYDDLDESLHIESHGVNDNKLKNNKTMRKNNDRMLLESLVRKYGKNSLVKAINELKSETYHSAYRKANQLGRKNQAAKFLGAFNKTKDAELKTALRDSLGELIEEDIINSPDMLLNEVISTRLGDTIGFVFQGSRCIYAPMYDDDTDLDEMVTIIDELGYYEGDFEFGSIDDILNEIKGTLSIQDARKLSRKLSQLYGTTGNQFDWHQFAEL